MLTVDKTSCTACGECVKVCPVQAIEMAPDGFPALKADNLCVGCEDCVSKCPENALKYIRGGQEVFSGD